MKTGNLLIMIFGMLFASSINAQNKADGIYAWDSSVFLKISKDSFSLYLYPIYNILYDLDKGDTILSEGTVKYESDNFIQLTSKNYHWATKKNVRIIESYDEAINDSIRFKFIFPFEGRFKIILYLEKGNKYSNSIEYEFYNSKEMVVPAPKDSLITFSYRILNQTPVEDLSWRIYYQKAIDFSSFNNTAKSILSNSFEISIPDLTNSYFNRPLIEGEYAKISTCVGGMKCIMLGGWEYSKM